MNDYSNRQVEFPNRIQLIKVPGTEDIYDYIWVPGRITNPGGIANEAFFKSIDDDIKAKLPKTNKATQAQAEAGTDNTNYMTPLTTAQEIEALKNIKYNNISCSTSTNTTINLSNYINEKVVKVELIINVSFYNSSSITISGTRIDDVGSSSSGSTSKTIENTQSSANLIITIFPKQNKFQIIGVGNSDVSSKTYINQAYSYDTISSITLGKLNSNNYDNPVSLIQYLN